MTYIQQLTRCIRGAGLFKYSLLVLLFGFWGVTEVKAQKKLIVKQVERATAFYPEAGKACVELISPLEELHVVSTFGEEVTRELNEDKLYVYRFVFDLADEAKRTLYISAPGFVREELRLAMSSKQKLIYTVFPPVERFNFTPGLLLEYVYSGTAATGVRLSLGKRLGGYVSYKTSGLSQEGVEIEEVTRFYDLTGAQEEGYIRQSYTAGLRLGIQRWLYLYLGGGFGEYGRLWENSSPVEGNSRFTRDYEKGPEAEVGLSFRLGNVALSAGVNTLFGEETLCDYSVGLGFYINFKKRK